MTNKNIVKKAVILLVAAFLMFSGMAYRAKGETLYTLENLIVNGDFEPLRTLSGWTYSTATWDNGTLKQDTSSSFTLYQTIP